jgi:hypothetical protein
MILLASAVFVAQASDRSKLLNPHRRKTHAHIIPKVDSAPYKIFIDPKVLTATKEKVAADIATCSLYSHAVANINFEKFGNCHDFIEQAKAPLFDENEPTRNSDPAQLMLHTETAPMALEVAMCKAEAALSSWLEEEAAAAAAGNSPQQASTVTASDAQRRIDADVGKGSWEEFEWIDNTYVGRVMAWKSPR